MALPVVVAAPVGALPGTTQPVWQVAACELQAIMQFVTVEVCANRIVAAKALPPNPSTPTANPNANSIAHRRMTTFPLFAAKQDHGAAAQTEKCRAASFRQLSI